MRTDADPAVGYRPDLHGTHGCPANNCKRVVPNRMLMCYRHWRLVPADLRNRIIALWTPIMRGEPMGQDYLNARAEAVRSVNATILDRSIGDGGER